MLLSFIRLAWIFNAFSHLLQEHLDTNFQTIYFFTAFSIISGSVIPVFSSHQGLNVSVDWLQFLLVR